MGLFSRGNKPRETPSQAPAQNPAAVTPPLRVQAPAPPKVQAPAPPKVQVPSRPNSVGVDPGAVEITLCWTPPSKNGAMVSGYQVQVTNSRTGAERMYDSAKCEYTVRVDNVVEMFDTLILCVRAQSAEGFGRFTRPLEFYPIRFTESRDVVRLIERRPDVVPGGLEREDSTVLTPSRPNALLVKQFAVTLHLSWSPPSKCAERVTGYQIQVVSADTGAKKQFSTTACEFDLKLSDEIGVFDDVAISVRAVCNGGVGNYTQAVVVTSEDFRNHAGAQRNRALALAQRNRALALAVDSAIEATVEVRDVPVAIVGERRIMLELPDSAMNRGQKTSGHLSDDVD